MFVKQTVYYLDLREFKCRKDLVLPKIKATTGENFIEFELVHFRTKELELADGTFWNVNDELSISSLLWHVDKMPSIALSSFRSMEDVRGRTETFVVFNMMVLAEIAYPEWFELNVPELYAYHKRIELI